VTKSFKLWPELCEMLKSSLTFWFPS